MQIRPNAPLPIVYVISDPSDSATYYVRSVIRNSATGSIIQVSGANFVNLTVSASNSRRFSKTIQSPQDSSGVGFYIDVTTTVYTDSGYTTVSPVYQEENVKYLVLEPWTTGLGLGGGGWTGEKAASIDYEKIKALILEVFTNLPTTDLPEPIDIAPLLFYIKECKRILEAFKIPEPKEVDLTSHTQSIKDLAYALKNFKIPEYKEPDFTPLHEAIKEIPKHPETLSPDEHRKAYSTITAEIQKLKTMKPFNEYNNLMDSIAAHITNVRETKKPEEEKAENTINLRAKALIG